MRAGGPQKSSGPLTVLFGCQILLLVMAMRAHGPQNFSGPLTVLFCFRILQPLSVTLTNYPQEHIKFQLYILSDHVNCISFKLL